MSCGCWIISEFMIICFWCCFGTCCWWIDIMSIPICELLLLSKNCESLVNCWILMKWCFNLKFYASLSIFSCIWPINIIWNEFWVGKYQNLGFWVKRVWNPKIFDRTDECSLKRAISELQASVPSSFWIEFAWASCKRALNERN